MWSGQQEELEFRQVTKGRSSKMVYWCSEAESTSHIGYQLSHLLTLKWNGAKCNEIIFSRNLNKTFNTKKLGESSICCIVKKKLSGHFGEDWMTFQSCSSKIGLCTVAFYSSMLLEEKCNQMDLSLSDESEGSLICPWFSLETLDARAFWLWSLVWNSLLRLSFHLKLN